MHEYKEKISCTSHTSGITFLRTFPSLQLVQSISCAPQLLADFQICSCLQQKYCMMRMRKNVLITKCIYFHKIKLILDKVSLFSDYSY